MAKCVWSTDKFRGYPISLSSTQLYIHTHNYISLHIAFLQSSPLINQSLVYINVDTIVFGLLIRGGVALFFFSLEKKMKENAGNPLHLTSLNHVSLLCRSVDESMNFYNKVLGFIPIRRPESLNFEGAWYPLLALSFY